jgi:hypothetical protein
MLLSTKKVKTFNKASSSVKSVIVLLRGRFDKFGLKKSEISVVEELSIVSKIILVLINKG